ncbi:uncharacterized protein [Clytia hemisphaerica]|uniref:Leucine-rich repeat and IQ domain-containing protein 3 n=1 Tax=Clytia hemisphaerica TaxID=252671 RepID=A0A7M5WLX0_9CNID
MKENVEIIKTKKNERALNLSSANRWYLKSKQNEKNNKDRKPWRKNSPKPQPIVFHQQNLLKNAQNEGYLHDLTEEVLLENSENVHNKRSTYPGDVVYLSAASQHLQQVSLLDLCERLEICDLSNNFIDDIGALRWCHNLFFLDVHSNQLSSLPGKKFWSSLPKLSLVYLHDNAFSRVEEIKYLSHSPSLSSLTLYDSPVSLKKNYRHCVVNAVWTLKALDGHVVSDEEIIEDADFTENFKPLKKQFRYQSPFCSKKPKERRRPTHNEFKLLIKEELSKINTIQSKYCPVLILQRCIRGFLVRLKYNYIKDTRLWAAVSIQRFYRDRKGYPRPPPTSPNLQFQDHLYQSFSSMRLDYETYLRLRRSKHAKSSASFKSLHYRLLQAESHDARVNGTCLHSGLPRPIHRHISVDLQKLEGQTTQILNRASKLSGSKHNHRITVSDRLQDSVITRQTGQIPTAGRAQRSAHLPRKTPDNLEQIAEDLGVSTLLCHKQPKSAPPTTIGKYQTQYAFLGKIETPNRIQDDNDEETQFRLSIRKPDVITHDPLEELIMRTVEGADDIRTATRDIDRKMKMKSAIVPSIKKTFQSSHLQRAFMKTQTGMNFSAFKAVEKAYNDRDKAEVLLRKTHVVKKVKHQEKMTRNKVKRSQKAHKKNACANKDSDRVKILEGLRVHRQRELDLQDVTAQFREQRAKESERARRSYQFALNFRSQNASVGKALTDHDHVKRRLEASQKKVKRVEELRVENEEKKELMRDYQEQKVMLKRADISAARDAIELQLVKNSTKRECDLQDHLRKYKNKHTQILRSPNILAVSDLHLQDAIPLMPSLV